MPDEREMAEINEAIQPQEPLLPRAERRRIAREQPVSDRFTGVKRCDRCGFQVELEREPIPERCDGCGFRYDTTVQAPEDYDQVGSGIESSALKRRHAAAVEGVGGAIELLAEGVNRLADVFGDIGEAVAQRIGKAGR